MDEYLLACCRYVELNPVRAGIVRAPEDYQWSSYKHKVEIEYIDWIDMDPIYKSLGSTKKQCEERYKAWMKESIREREWDMIRQAVQRGQLTGSSQFIEEVVKKIGRRVEFRGQGRPKRENKSVPFFI